MRRLSRREIELVDQISDLSSSKAVGEAVRGEMAAHCLRSRQTGGIEGEADVSVNIRHGQRCVSEDGD